MRTLALLQRSGCKAFPEVEHGRQPAELGCRIKNTRLPPAALAYLLGFAFSWKCGGMSAFAERFAAHLSGCGAELRRKASVKAKAEMLQGRGAWPPPGLVCSRNGGCSPIGSPPFSLGVSAQAAHLHGAERGRLCTPWGWGLGTWRGWGGGRGGWSCRPRGHQRSDVQGGRGRETGSFSFPPVGGGEHGNNAVGDTGSQPGACWQKQTLCTQSGRAGEAVLAPRAGMGGGGHLGLLGVTSQGQIYL